MKCVICGNVLENAEGRYTSMAKSTNMILLLSLSMAGQQDIESARSFAEAITRPKLKICHIHFVHAAQYFLAEMALVGRRVSHFYDPCAGGRTAYVTDGDIPRHLLDVLNRMANGSVSITSRDVSRFLNDALKRYYSTAVWPVTEEVDVMHVGADGGEDSREPREAPEDAREENGDKGSTAGEVDEESADSCSEVNANEAEVDNVSEWSPDHSSEESDSSSTSSSSVFEPLLRATKPAVLDHYFLVKGLLLMQLFQFCPQCGHKLSETELVGMGTAALVKFVCTRCDPFTPCVKRWESQERTVSHSKERSLKGNVAAVVAAITTGLGYAELRRWAEELGLALFSRAFFRKVFKLTKPAIEHVYQCHQKFVLDEVRARYGRGVGLHLAADGAFDSRGFSALIGKVVFTDTRTKLVVHTEVLHRSETGGISGRMEVEGLRRGLRFLKLSGVPVASLTTDRSKALGAVLKQLEPEIGAIRHYYDGWHLAKWLGNKLREVSKTRRCALISVWIETLKSHLWYSIGKGAQEGLIREMFNTCLMHVLNVHEWPQEELTGPFVRCGHDPLDGPTSHYLTLESRAYERLREVALAPSFQQDLAKASPFGSTSICESKNSLDRIYCRKEKYFPKHTYTLYCMMSTMHMNALRLAEDTGERQISRIYEVQRKFLARKSTKVSKTPAEHTWRKYIFQDVLRRRLLKWNGGRHDGDDDDVERELYVS